MRTKLYMIGGFLGSGKTTFLAKLAEDAQKAGVHAGLITNDQAAGLVDTEFLQRTGVPVEEVSGSCFCCNFPGFMRSVQKLKDDGAEVIYAESVGSCTDLTATIIQPVEDKYRDSLQPMPFTVLADPKRLKEILEGGDAGFAPDAAYILRMQMEEADVIAISKADTLPRNEKKLLVQRTEKKFPLASVVCVSALTGEGVEDWRAEVEEMNCTPGMHPADVDYDRYAAGEAALGWLNMKFEAKSSDGMPGWRAKLEELLRTLSEKMVSAHAAVGHIKVFAQGENYYAKGHLTGGMETLQIEAAGEEVPAVSVLVNARVEMLPEKLLMTVLETVRSVFDASCEVKMTQISCLTPGRPNPTWHYANGRSDRDQVDLFLINGFLGSGKTTFLRHILENNRTKIPTGVIVNEFGSLGIDAEVLTPGSADIVQINNGSIFCACMKGGFVRTLAEFLTKPVKRLFVEASGMADPSSMEKLLEEMMPYVSRRFETERSYRYRGSVCVVDAVNFIDLSADILAGYNQVRKSNLILLNKTDLCDRAQIQKVRDVVGTINPDAFLYETSYAVLPEEIMDKYLKGETIEVGASTNRCDDRLFAGTLTIPDGAERKKLRAFLQEISDSIIRVKGWVHLAGSDGMSCVRVDGTGPILTMEESKEPHSGLSGRLQLISDSEKDQSAYLEREWKKFMTGDFEFVTN